jgi:hypothetical protein
MQRWSDIKGTSVCYMWPVCDISMPFSSVGMSGRGVVIIMSFSIHVFKLYKGT